MSGGSAAIDWMPQEQVLFDDRPRLFHSLAVGDEDGALGSRCLAGRHQPRLHHDLAGFLVLLARLDKAHAAARHDRQSRMPAVIGNLDAGPLGRLNAVQALLLAEGDFDSVNDDYGHLFVGCVEQSGTHHSVVGVHGAFRPHDRRFASVSADFTHPTRLVNSY